MNNAVPKNDTDGRTLTKRNQMMLIKGELTTEDILIAVDRTIERGVSIETLRQYVDREEEKTGPDALATQEWFLSFILGFHTL